MKVGHVSGQRQQLIDRSFEDKSEHLIIDAYGPHGFTDWLTYTVPTGKRAVLTAAVINFKRASAAGTPGQIQARVLAGAAALIVEGLCRGNNINDGDSMALAPGHVISSGLSVILSSGDSSTGGTVDYRLEAGIIEIDV